MSDDESAAPSATSTPAADSTPTAPPTQPATTATPDSEASAPPPTATAESTVSDWSEKILGLAAVEPANIELFTSDYSLPGAYPEGSAMQPAGGPEKSGEQIRQELEDFLRADPALNETKIAETLALFDDPAVIERAPDPNLRAGFVLLNLTLAAPLIDYVLETGPFTGPMEWGDTGFDYTEESATWPDGTRRITLNERYRHEHFGLLAASFPMSALHHDAMYADAEDVLVIAISTMAHMQLLASHPELAYEGTELARILNTYCLALLNSHRPGSGDMAIVAPQGTGVLPGSPLDAPDFWTLLEGEGISPAPPVLRTILQGILDEDADLDIAAYYSIDSAELVSEHLTGDWLAPEGRVGIAVLLQTITPAEIAAILDTDEATVIETFGLDPFLAAIQPSPSTS